LELVLRVVLENAEELESRIEIKSVFQVFVFIKEHVKPLKVAIQESINLFGILNLLSLFNNI
jgi:hypothetical protein